MNITMNIWKIQKIKPYPFKYQAHKMVKHSANCRRIVWVCLTVSLNWRLKG